MTLVWVKREGVAAAPEGVSVIVTSASGLGSATGTDVNRDVGLSRLLLRLSLSEPPPSDADLLCATL